MSRRLSRNPRMRAADYEWCPGNEDGRHGPIRPAFFEDPEINDDLPPSRWAFPIRCVACGLTTAYHAPPPDDITWG